MYFTDQKNGKINAMYSGRFAYIISKNEQHSLDVFDEVVEDRIHEKIELVEEYKHYKLFSKSISGLYINGIRWIVRFFYNIFNFYWMPYDYYKARSIFFGLSYEFHEKNVFKEKINKFSLFKIDIKIIKESLKYSKIYVLLFPFFPLVLILGYVLSYHFTVIISVKSPLGYRKTYISRQSYSGVNNKSNKNNKLQKKLMKFNEFIQIEKYLSRGDKINWLLAKFSAEKNMWKKFNSDFKFGDDNTYEDYIKKLVSFVERWNHGTGTVPKFANQLLMNPTIENYIELKDKIEDIDSYTWFSYQHGN